MLVFLGVFVFCLLLYVLLLGYMFHRLFYFRLIELLYIFIFKKFLFLKLMVRSKAMCETTQTIINVFFIYFCLKSFIGYRILEFFKIQDEFVLNSVLAASK